MDWKDLNNLAALSSGELTGMDTQSLIAEWLEDSEAGPLLSLLLSPDLRVENNYPLPFATPAESVIGLCEDLLIPVEMTQFRYSDPLNRLASRVNTLLHTESIPLVTPRLGLESNLPNASGPIQFNLKVSPEEGSCLLEVSARGSRDRIVEFWESGLLVMRIPLSAISDSFSYHLKPGIAVAVREVEAGTGSRFLVIETELTRKEWKAALVGACLSGDIRRAVSMLQNPFFMPERGGTWLAGIQDRIAALTSLTKTDQLVLQPIPITRGPDSESDQSEAVHRLVWNGIVNVWPEANDLPNPWSTGATSESMHQKLSLDDEALLLVESCIRSSQGGSISDESQHLDSSSPYIQNGWAALVGWRALLDRDYDKAHHTFITTSPIEGDPFSLEMGRVLTRHLELTEGTGRDEKESSSDRIWGRILSTVS